MNLRIDAVAAALVCIAMLVAGCQPDAAQKDKGGGAPPTPTVSVADAIKREVAEWDEFTGRLEAVESVEVRPRVSGQIERVGFREGTEVKKGDLLFVIDQRPFRAEVDRAQAELARAQPQVELARQLLQRVERLVGEGGVSKQELDERASAVQQAEAAVRGTQAALDSARLNLEFTEVRAAIGGRIGRAEMKAGNLVSANQTLLTTIVSLDPIYAWFEGDESVYLRYQDLSRSGERPSSRDVRNPVYLGLSNEEGHPHKGYVDFVDNRVDPRTGTIRARGVFPNRDRRFTPGLFARIKLVGSGTYRAVLINDRAVGTDQSQKFVFVLGADGKVQYRPVKLGPMIDGLRVVKEGLKGGETILVNNIQRVRPGMPVNPQKVPMQGPATSAQGQAAPAESKAGEAKPEAGKPAADAPAAAKGK